jgi:hypothetical protein
MPPGQFSGARRVSESWLGLVVGAAAVTDQVDGMDDTGGDQTTCGAGALVGATGGGGAVNTGVGAGSDVTLGCAVGRVVDFTESSGATLGQLE